MMMLRRACSSVIFTVALPVVAFASPVAAADVARPTVCHDASGNALPCVSDGVGQPGSTAVASPTAVSEDKSIVVTGSRIPRLQYEAPNPVVSLTAGTIQNAGLTNITDFLSRYPSLVGSQTSATTAGGDLVGETGLNLLNLRNLGTQRTLVLVDGRRHVAGEPGTAAVDINTIPADLIERVDILTGGVSAVYGADAVSGVVNFIMKKNFEGISAHAQTGISSRGDAAQHSASFTIGHNFGGGRGNVSFAYQYGKENELTSYDRRRLSVNNRVVFVPNPDYNGDLKTPVYIPITNARYTDSSRNGAIDVDGDGLPDYTGGGLPYDHGTEYDGGYTQGGSSTPVSDYGEDLQPEVVRHIFNISGHYDFSDAFKLYGEAKFVFTHSFTLGQPSFDYLLEIQADNPYLRSLPAAAQAQIQDTGEALLNRDNFDLGLRGEDILRHTYRAVIGAKGDITPTLHYDVSYVFGETTARNTLIGDQYSDRFFAAIDAVDDGHGGITCRVNVDPSWTATQFNYGAGSSRSILTPTTFSPGQCIPLNLIGENVANPAAIAWITTPTTIRDKVIQHVATASITGDTSNIFALPGGPIGFSIGAEYRWEGYDHMPDAAVQQGLTYTPQDDPVHAHYAVKEVFGEVNLPIFTEKPFAQILSTGAAIRYSDYTTIGHTLTWNVNANWAPIRDIEFRATYSHSVRAPNLTELHARFQTYASFNDPCNSYNLTAGTSTRVANCATLFAGATQLAGTDDGDGGFTNNPADYVDPRAYTIPGTQQGNPNLKAETAKTLTAGIVLRPRFLPGLNLSVDWYDIKLVKAINYADANDIARLCVDAPSLANNYCSLIQRDPDTGLIVNFEIEPQNVASFRTRGLDMNLNYFIKPKWKYGSFALQVEGNYLNHLDFTSLPGADPTNELGSNSYPAPHFQVTGDVTWKLGSFSLNYGVQWFSKTYRASRLTSTNEPNVYASEYFFIKPLWQHDVEASFDVTTSLSLYAGCNNITDAQPAVAESSYPISAIGRYFFAGARIKMPNLF